MGDCVAWKPEMAPQAIDTNIMGNMGWAPSLWRDVSPSAKPVGMSWPPNTRIAKQSGRHKEQGKAENGVEVADELVDGQECGKNVITEYRGNPECFVKGGGRHAVEQSGGVHKVFAALLHKGLEHSFGVGVVNIDCHSPGSGAHPERHCQNEQNQSHITISVPNSSLMVSTRS